MTPPQIRTTACEAHTRRERLQRADEFWAAAQDLSALSTNDGPASNAIVTLYIHAGIAASDVICCARLGEYSRSENHADALSILKRAEPSLVSALQRLLAVKTDAGYGAASMSATKVDAARRASEKLIFAAHDV